MRNSYPAIVVISSFLPVLATILFTDINVTAVVLGWVVGIVGGAGAVSAYVIEEFNGK